MSDVVLIALITALPSTLAAVAALVVSIRNGKMIEVVHKATNSLVAQGRADSKELGVLEGKAEEKANPS